MSCKSFWQHFKKKKGRGRAATRDAVWLPKVRPWQAKGRRATAGCCNLNAYVSFLGALESFVRPSTRVWHPFRAWGWGRGRGRANLAAASSKYLCLCFIYLHCQNQFCPRVQLFFTFMPRPHPLPTSPYNPLQQRPCAATVGDTHAKHGRKCCLFSIKNLSSTNARSKLIPGPFIGSRQVLKTYAPAAQRYKDTRTTRYSLCVKFLELRLLPSCHSQLSQLQLVLNYESISLRTPPAFSCHSHTLAAGCATSFAAWPCHFIYIAHRIVFYHFSFYLLIFIGFHCEAIKVPRAFRRRFRQQQIHFQNWLSRQRIL